MMPTAEQQDRMGARKLAKLRSRQHLIEAAAEAIFRHGLRGVSAARIQEISGLSRGMVNLHFQSQANLFLAVAQELAARYSSRWKAIAGNPELGAADRLAAIIRADFDPEVLNNRDVAVWFAFRAEAGANPQLLEHIDSRDHGFRMALTGICEELVAEAGYDNADPGRTAIALIALLEGMWTDFHIHSDRFDREDAIRICLFTARTFFPQHSF